MRRLFLRGLLAPVVTLAGDDAHHLLYAMRAGRLRAWSSRDLRRIR